MFKKKKSRRRRSEMRLGVQAINYKTSAAPSLPGLSLKPLLSFWQNRGAKIVGLLVLSGLMWGLYTLFSTPTFFVYRADIEGNVAVSAAEIYAAAEVHNQSVFWVNATKVARHVETLPNIKTASVAVSFPAQVSISVVERLPELVWQTGDTTWWVDQEGTIVPPKQSVEGMLRIIDNDHQPVQPGYRLDPTIVQGAQRLRVLVPGVSVVRYSRAMGLTVATPEGHPVYLGDGEEIKAKLVVLTALLAELKTQDITPAFIDVRNPLRPVYKPEKLIQIRPPGISTPRE